MRAACILTTLVLLLSTLGVAAGAPALPEVRLPAKNFVNNGGFERGTAGWRYFSASFGGVVTDEKHGGGSCFKATGMGTDNCYFQQENVPLTPGKTYTLSAWTKSTGFKRAGDNTYFLNLVNWGWTKGNTIGPVKPDEEWTRHTTTFVAPETKSIGERPFYNLIIFWPIKSEGTVWVDDIQIEEGNSATDFADQYTGWAMDALATATKAHTLAQATRTTLAANFSEMSLTKSLDGQAAEIAGQCEKLAAQVGNYATLPLAVAQSLPADAARLAERAEGLKYVYYLGDPYLPLPEQATPATPPASMQVDWTCLAGEQRAVAVNVVNLTGTANSGRVAPGELYDLTRQVRCPGTTWVSAHSVPTIRGFISTQKLFTDPLPRVDNAGCFPIGDGRVSQVILIVNTEGLLPGEYEGQVDFASLTEVAEKRPVKFHVKVLPVRLPALSGVDVCDVGEIEDWALDSVGPLGLNTFFLQAQWLRPEYDPSGKLAMTIDFSRSVPFIKSRLALCPQARFAIGFGVGAVMTNYLERAYSLKPSDPKFTACATAWVQEVLKHFAALGVGPERVVFETIDEPGEGQLALAVQWAEIIRKVEPKARSFSYLTWLNLSDPASLRLYQALDIVAPGVGHLKPEAVARLQEMGKTVWTYDCQNNGETFHPIAYYRLLPWQSWRYGLKGWGHFEWLAADRGRKYRTWEGVAEEATVYPAIDGGQVISRRWLALVAGVQDYRVLQMLTSLTANARQKAPDAEAVARADKLLKETPAQAMALLKTSGDYFTDLAPGADPTLLDRFREQAARVAGDLSGTLEKRPAMRVALSAAADKPAVRVVLPRAGKVAVRYLCNRQLPWRTVSADLPAGAHTLALKVSADETVSRCLAEHTDSDGLVQVVSAKPWLTVTVDSTAESYSPVQLNDGLAMVGMKFEPEYGWISAGGSGEHWVVATLGAPRPVKEVRVWWMTFGGLPQGYKLQVWANGHWQDAAGFTDGRAAKAAMETLRLPGTTTDKVRILQKPGGGGHGVPSMMGLSEIEVE
ncbi:MAG: carbohydrate binding domain-containing protein [Armatimonadota bacterium]